MTSATKTQAATELFDTRPRVNSVDAMASVASHVCPEVLRSLPRCDQRAKGEDYVTGLLKVRGRKSARNMAASMGQSMGREVSEQNLHHFVNSSTWDWWAVRRDLTSYLTSAYHAAAWVVTPMLIPKAGVHSVGVDRRYCPRAGRAVNGQLALSVWLAADGFAVPVSWRLHLSQPWLESTTKKSKTSIPEDYPLESVSGCALSSFQEFARVARPAKAPVIFDLLGASGADLAQVFGTLAHQVATTRVPSDLQLQVVDPAFAGYQGRVLPAAQIVQATKGSRRTEQYVYQGRRHLISIAKVQLADPAAPRSRTPLTLVGMTPLDHSRARTELWLTNDPEFSTSSQAHQVALADHVQQGYLHLANRMGMQDFAGRSFTGWHRHATLVSIAAAVGCLVSPGLASEQRTSHFPQLDGELRVQEPLGILPPVTK
ncbi:transposase [Mycobacteroides franklinii]|uniref:Transposase n=1 Tax=Mycobacteroides franklinii TaxID=948102 RepID=A0A1S1L6B3_9MYCO|nr:transposase [Mycobacteroides franklinii]NGX05911.1 transposase [Mycobacteroides franklinii]OHU20975.1 transposase [Mycobacteroides franklinii]